MAKKKALGDNPLFSPVVSSEVPGEKTEEPVKEDFSEIVTDEKIEEVKRSLLTLREMKHELSQLEQRKKNREDNFQRMTFIVRKDLLEKFRDYCFTERLSQKEGLERALSEFLEDKEDLVKYPARPKQIHKRN